MSMKYVCDLCGADATQEKFVIPMINTYYVTGISHKKLASFSKMEACEVNLCAYHQTTIANLLSLTESE